jgi:hypothetical protein
MIARAGEGTRGPQGGRLELVKPRIPLGVDGVSR